MTLLVTPEDAERIALAQSEGQIMLALRNPLDTDADATAGVGRDALFGREAPAPRAGCVRAAARCDGLRRAAPCRRGAGAQALHVEAIRAAKRTEEVIK